MGRSAFSDGLDAIAVGRSSEAIGTGAIAFGGDGNDGDNSGAQATAQNAVAFGADAEASGINSLAVGNSSVASGVNTAAFGSAARASVNGATAVGFQAQANGVASTVVGFQANASANSAVAVGRGANAGFADSTAVGRNATTTAAGQVALGGEGSAVRIGDIAASTDAQSGAVDVVTVDANGVLGRQASVSTTAFRSLQNSVRAVSQVNEAQFDALANRVNVAETRLNNLDFELSDLDESLSGGIAAAMAMGSAPIVPGKNISMTVAASTYRGEQAFAGSITGRMSDSFYISASVSGNTGDDSVGARVAGTFGF